MVNFEHSMQNGEGTSRPPRRGGRAIAYGFSLDANAVESLPSIALPRAPRQLAFSRNNTEIHPTKVRTRTG
jgi:hypothetical protein